MMCDRSTGVRLARVIAVAEGSNEQMFGAKQQVPRGGKATR